MNFFVNKENFILSHYIIYFFYIFEKEEAEEEDKCTQYIHKLLILLIMLHRTYIPEIHFIIIL